MQTQIKDLIGARKTFGLVIIIAGLVGVLLCAPQAAALDQSSIISITGRVIFVNRPIGADTFDPPAPGQRFKRAEDVFWIWSAKDKRYYALSQTARFNNRLIPGSIVNFRGERRRHNRGRLRPLHAAVRRLGALQRGEILACPPVDDRAEAPTTAAVSILAAHPLSDIPQLSSRPGAAFGLYLDFVAGQNIDLYGNPLSPLPFSTDGDATTFSDSELTVIQKVWARVAEKYSPFDVNVTTVPLVGYGFGYGVHVLISGDGAWTGGRYGGISWVGLSGTSHYTAYVFPANLANNDKYIAEAAAHEAGHALSLSHQHEYNSSGNYVTEYYQGTSALAPLMGVSYYATRGVWWKGPAYNSSATQDDIPKLTSYTLQLRNDDIGNSRGTATALSVSGGSLLTDGVLHATNDIDVFSFLGGPGDIQCSVANSAYGPMSDLTLALDDAAGQSLAAVAPSNSLSASFALTLDSYGSYYISVGSTLLTTYDNPLGQYSVACSGAGVSSSNPTATPTATPTVTNTPTATPTPTITPLATYAPTVVPTSAPTQAPPPQPPTVVPTTSLTHTPTPTPIQCSLSVSCNSRAHWCRVTTKVKAKSAKGRLDIKRGTRVSQTVSFTSDGNGKKQLLLRTAKSTKIRTRYSKPRCATNYKNLK